MHAHRRTSSGCRGLLLRTRARSVGTAGAACGPSAASDITAVTRECGPLEPASLAANFVSAPTACLAFGPSSLNISTVFASVCSLLDELRMISINLGTGSSSCAATGPELAPSATAREKIAERYIAGTPYQSGDSVRWSHKV